MRQRKGKGGNNVARSQYSTKKKGVKIYDKFYPIKSLNKVSDAAPMIDIEESQIYDALQSMEMESVYELIEFSIQLYRQSGIYRKAISHFGNMLPFDHYIFPWTVEENHSSTVSDFRNVAYGTRRYRIKEHMPQILKRMLVHGTAYQYKLENSGRIEFFDLPWRSCRVRAIEDGVMKVLIDLDQIEEDDILDEDGELLDIYPEEIQSAWVAYDEGSINEEDLVDESWFVLSDEAFAMSLDENILSNGGIGVPYFIAVFLDAVRYERAKGLLDDADALDNAKIIDMKFKVNDNGENLMDEGTVIAFVNMINDALPEGVQAIASPFDAQVLNLQGNVGAAGKMSLAEKHKANFHRAMGVNPLVFGQEANSGEAMKLSIIMDLNVLYSSFLPQIVSYMNFEFERQFTGFGDWAFGMPDVSHSFRDKAVEMEEKGLAFGTERLIYLATKGREPFEVANIMDFEQNVLHIDDWMVPKATGHTASGGTEGGRPTTSNPSASTEQTRDRA